MAPNCCLDSSSQKGPPQWQVCEISGNSIPSRATFLFKRKLLFTFLWSKHLSTVGEFLQENGSEDPLSGSKKRQGSGKKTELEPRACSPLSFRNNDVSTCLPCPSGFFNLPNLSLTLACLILNQ